ncbi:hypothetical protein H5407_04130 [Mitsuaria sp. WAJ17]|uniref:M56 family metallopeptidase n=1 Tax=Mitsuaria sp. WAJ17 TaxID=2761452 RepID=UPI001600B702|nr:M56 family metallopeptidase [Mitsuaria sp. WAJ17]MBB2484409.1 hypothetical protein [Mitsuaria sp. WAJ17]
MTEAAWTQLLPAQTLLFSAAVLLLALLRPVLRRLLDAGAVYLAWLLVPLMMLSPALPRMVRGQVLPVPVQMLERVVPGWPGASPVSEGLAGASSASPPARFAGLASRRAAAPALMLGLWSLGAGSLLILLVRRQRRFTRGLRRLDRAWQAPAGASPALMGLLQARLVLPMDFEQRFSAREQALILAHEAVHARRHDNAWNLLAAGLLVLQWFNPLAWWALRAMRLDQELACDAAVLNQPQTHHPGEETLVKTYVTALLKSHPQRALPVLSTGWAHRHPLLERVKGLRLHRRPRWQRLLGRGSALGLCLGVTLLARAAQPVSANEAYERMMQFLERESAVMGVPPLGLVVQLDSQQGQEGWQHKDAVFAFAHTLQDTYAQMQLVVPMKDWCLGLHLYRFPGGEFRPQSEILDKDCRKTLTELQPMQLGKGQTSLMARLPGGPQEVVQAQVGLRMEDPRGDGFQALYRKQVASMSPEQLAQMAGHIEERSRDRSALRAQDKAWRQARGEQP